MNNKFHDAFEPIRATERLKQNTNAFIHTEVLKRQRKMRGFMRYTAACCAMLILVVCGFTGYNFYQTPISYISVDVNPSVELALNSFDRVVATTAYNDDGALVLKNLNLKNKPYTEALELLLSNKTFESYLFDDSYLSFTVVSDREEILLAGIQKCQGYTENQASCHSANVNNMDAAHHSGMSVGKYQAYLELAQYDKSITPDDCQHLSMHQIRDLISEYTSEESIQNEPNGRGQGYGIGQGQCNEHNDEKGRGNGYHGGRD